MNLADINTQNGKSKIINAMDLAGISTRGVARQLNISQFKVRAVLDTEKFVYANFGELVRVRERVEQLLEAAGFEFTKEQLWDEYDLKQKDAA